jgi:hypothetical protein
MLVFIDESGCRGVKLVRGSDPVFVIAMVIFRNALEAVRTETIIRDLRVSLNYKSEFKFNKCRDAVRDNFFRAVTECAFTVDAMVVQQDFIHGAHAGAKADVFYTYLVMQLMKCTGEALSGARIRIDGSAQREFQRALSSRLRRELRGKVRHIEMTDSIRNPLIQLADMCAGAIGRAYRDRSRADRWLEMLRPHISSISEYK